jgi:hypothetical protein
MKRINIPRPNQLALVIAAAFFSQATWADSGDTPATPATPAPPVQPEASSPTTGTAVTSGGSWFDTTTSAGQQAFTPSYEQGATGPGGGGTKTAVARGAPIVTSSGIFIYPNVNLGAGYNDNIIATPTNAISSYLVTLQPSFVGEMKTHGDRYTVDYAGNYTQYTSDSNDNFYNNTLMFAGDDFFGSRTRLSWDAGYITRSDPRGSTDRPTATGPDRWHSLLGSGLFAYGSAGAIGRVEVEASEQEKRYDNDLLFTQAGDLNLSNVAARFFYRISPKTSLLFEFRNTKAEYQLAGTLLDNTERRYYVGTTWEATAATTGTIKVGRLTKDFDSPGTQNFAGSSWEAAIRWKPRTYSSFDLVTSKSTADPTGFGEYLVNQNVSVAWTHNWTTYLTSRVTAGLLKTDFAGTDRNDDMKNYGLGLTYEMRRWLRVSLDWTGTRRTSSQSQFDFDRNVTMLTLEGTL